MNETPSAPAPEVFRKVAKKLPFTTASVPLYEVLLNDPLGSAARGERRNLLTGAVTVLLVAHVGLVPEKIESLGIRIYQADLQRLGNVFFWVMVYFMVMFLVYAIADLLARVHEYVDRKQAGILEDQRTYATHEQQTQQGGGERLRQRLYSHQPPTSSGAAQVLSQQFPGIHGVRRVAKPFAMIRAIVDFALPIVIGTWALFQLWFFSHPKASAAKPRPPVEQRAPAKEPAKPPTS